MSYAVAVFLLQWIGVSLSGVMAPGPMTTAALAGGMRRRHAGLLLGLGHVIVEGSLMLLLIGGLAALFEKASFRIGVGLAGGAALLLLGGMMLSSLKRPVSDDAPERAGNPVTTGIVLSAGNPYFLLWWATAGLGMLVTAKSLGVLALALFAILHWLCDLIWLEVLSVASFKGSKVLGPRGQRVIILTCGVAMAVFGVYFVYKAAGEWRGTV